MYWHLHVASIAELDNSFAVEKSVLVSAASVTELLLKGEVRDGLVAGRAVQSVTLVDSCLAFWAKINR